MKINDFSGGLNTRVDPTLLLPNEAQVYENAEGYSGTLKSVKSPLRTQIACDKYYAYFEGKSRWISFDKETEFVEFNETFYCSNDSGIYYVADDGRTLHRIGIKNPTMKIMNLSDVSQNVPIEIIPISISGGQLIIGETYTYRVVIESPASSNPKKNITRGDIRAYLRTGNALKILVKPFSEMYVNSNVKLYRKNNREYVLVDEKTFTGTTLEFIDSEYNIMSTDTLFDSKKNTYKYIYTFYNSSKGVESAPSPISRPIRAYSPNFTFNILEASQARSVDKIRIYRIGGSITEFTLAKVVPNQTGTYFDFKSDSDIAGNQILDSHFNYPPPTKLRYIVQEYAILFGILKDRVYFSNIANPHAWPKTNYIDYNLNLTGLAPISNGLLVFTKYKTFIIIGNSPETFSSYLLNSSQGCLSNRSIVQFNQGVLWLSYDGLCYCEGGNITVLTYEKLGIFRPAYVFRAAMYNNTYFIVYIDNDGNKKVFCYDFRYNKVIKHMNFEGDNFYYAMGKLYIHHNGKLANPFKGNSQLTLKYKSPRYTEGELTNRKLYKNLYIYYDGDFIFKVFIDGQLTNNITLSGKGVKDLKLSSLKSHGYFIEFDIEGKGEIKEIEYQVEGRQNGNP